MKPSTNSVKIGESSESLYKQLLFAASVYGFLLSFVTWIPCGHHHGKRYQEPSIQWRDPGHPERTAQPKPRWRWRSVFTLFWCFLAGYAGQKPDFTLRGSGQALVTHYILLFFQMRVKVSTHWRLMCSCRLYSVWPLNPSATPSAPSESRLCPFGQSGFYAQFKLPFGFSRFHEILKTLTDTDEGRLHILKVVYDVWRNHPQVDAELSCHQQLLEAAHVTPVHLLPDDLGPGG